MEDLSCYFSESDIVFCPICDRSLCLDDKYRLCKYDGHIVLAHTSCVYEFSMNTGVRLREGVKKQTMNKVTIRYRHRHTEGYVEREVTHIWIIDGVVFFEDIEKDTATLFIDRPAYFSVLLNPQQEVSNAVKTASTRVAGQRRETG